MAHEIRSAADASAPVRSDPAADAEPGCRQREQPLPADGPAARLAAAIGAMLDALEGRLGLVQLTPGGFRRRLGQRPLDGRAPLVQPLPRIHRHQGRHVLRPFKNDARSGAPARAARTDTGADLARQRNPARKTCARAREAWSWWW